MGKRLQYIIISIAVLVSASLTLSTFHSHTALSFSSFNGDEHVEKTVSSDTSLCPICAYLLKSDTSVNTAGSTYLTGTFFESWDCQPVYCKRDRSIPLKRAPPLTV